MTRHIDLPGLRWNRIAPEPTDDPEPLALRRQLTTSSATAASCCCPPPGTRPGSMSLLVRQAGHPPLLMVGDLTYDVHVFEDGHVPGVGSRRRLREATAMVNKMRQHMPDLVILPAHDPGAADRLAQVTGQASGRPRRLTDTSPTCRISRNIHVGRRNEDRHARRSPTRRHHPVDPRSGRDASNPVLLLIQQGPGLPMINETRRFEQLLGLEKDFTVVYWDQRGCGRSLRGRNEPGPTSAWSSWWATPCRSSSSSETASAEDLGRRVLARRDDRRVRRGTAPGPRRDAGGGWHGHRRCRRRQQCLRLRAQHSPPTRQQRAIRQLEAIGPPPHLTRSSSPPGSAGRPTSVESPPTRPTAPGPWPARQPGALVGLLARRRHSNRARHQRDPGRAAAELASMDLVRSAPHRRPGRHGARPPDQVAPAKRHSGIATPWRHRASSWCGSRTLPTRPISRSPRSFGIC